MHALFRHGGFALTIGCLSLWLAAAGCGSTVTTESGSQGSGGSGASGASSANSSGNTGGGGDGGCASFLNEPSIASMTVRFINESGETIYLPAACGTLMYNLQSVEEEGTYIYDPSCLNTCEDMQVNPPILCEQCSPTSYRLPAGDTLEVVWDGSRLRTLEMPDSCWFESGFGGACSRIEAAPPGPYWIEAVGYSDCDEFGGACACDDSGLCFGDAAGEEAYADIAQLSFPDQSLVEVTFGVCAFGCP